MYEHNLEYNKLSREIKLLDAWLTSKDAYVNSDFLGDTIVTVEEQLKQHDDFRSMLEAMEPRFEQLKRENKLERTLRELKERESAQRAEVDLKLEEEKRKEQERRRKLEMRRQDERRRTQEIIANISSHQPSTVGVPTGGSSNSATVASIVPVPIAMDAREDAANDNAATEVSLKRVSSNLNKKDRNRTRSIRDKYRLPLRLQTPSIADFLMRKQEFQKGGQRAPIREYQNFYTTIHGNLMCFFIDKRDYNELNAASQPINLFECRIYKLEEPTLQRDVIHVETTDGAEYLFDAAGLDNNAELFNLWFAKLTQAQSNFVRKSKITA